MAPRAGSTLFGRVQELAVVLGALREAEPRAIVLGGHAGIGKTRLARAAAEAWDGDGMVWISASPGIRDIPFGAVARLLPDRPTNPEPTAGRDAELVRAAAALARQAPDRLIVVDDVHCLDELSALLVQQLVLDGVVPVLMTVRSGEPVASSVERLWRDRACDRVDLLPLARHEADELLADRLGGPAAPTTAGAWFTASNGSPLLLEELVRCAQEAGTLSLAPEGWEDRGGPDPLRRVGHVLEDRIGRLVGPDREAVALLSLGPPLSTSALALLVPDFDQGAAERRGLTALDVDGARLHVRLAHPLVGEAMLASCSPAEVATLRLRLADHFRSAGGRRRSDLLVEARLRLDAGDVSRPELFVEAARVALGLHAITEALELAAVARANGLPRAEVLLGGALFLDGRFEEAVVILEAVLPLLEVDADRVVAAYTLQNAYVYLHRDDLLADVTRRAQAAMVDPVWAGVVGGNALQQRMMAGATRDASAEAEALLLEHTDPRVRLRLVTSAGGGRSLSGRTAAALELAAETLPYALALREDMPMGPAWVVNTQAFALLLAGQLVEAGSFLELVGQMVASFAGGADGEDPWLVMMRGRIALIRGHATTALELLSSAHASFIVRDIGGFRRMAGALEAEALALLGRAQEARKALDDVLAQPVMSPLYEGDVLRSRAWVLAAEGRRSAALEQLEHVAALQELEGQLAMACYTLHEAMRLGSHPPVEARLADLASQIDGAWGPAFVAHVDARRLGTGEALSATAEAFTGIGADLMAAEVHTEAAQAFRAEALPARATAALRRRDEALEACGGVATPGLGDHEARAALTRREREIVALAARGLSDRAIAEELVVSVRTVEGHLHRAFAKLGVSSRGELSDIELA